jgi:putative ABC transport system ATP-binding protein
MRVHVLRGVSLDVQRWDMVAIIGLSGGGKTVLLNCLSRLDDIDSDVIAIAGSVPRQDE